MRKRYNLSIYILLIFLVMLSTFIFQGNNYLLSQTSGFISHSSISISGDAEFDSQAIADGWDGDGSQISPYIIQDYYIDSSGGNGIEITSTSYYFIIENNHIINSFDSSNAGIVITSSANVIIQNNQIETSYYGIFINGPNKAIVHNNTIDNMLSYAIFAQGGNYISITSNIIKNANTGIAISASNSTVFSNRIYDTTGFGGIFNHFSANYNNISNNYIVNSPSSQNAAIYISGGTNNTITQNVLINNTRGIQTAGSTTYYNNISSNIIIANSDQITVNDETSHFNPNFWVSNLYSDYTNSGQYVIPGARGSIDLSPILISILSDNDLDNLTDYDEIKIHKSNPYNNDTDFDGIYDYYEITNELNWLLDDTSSDLDNDGLNNLVEFQLGTQSNNSDSDFDELNDFLEISLGTDPLNNDTDDDQLPDGWEFLNGLNLKLNETYLDYDNDTLSNLEEYFLNTHPLKADTDNDGFSDNIEQDAGTDPNNQTEFPPVTITETDTNTLTETVIDEITEFQTENGLDITETVTEIREVTIEEISEVFDVPISIFTPIIAIIALYYLKRKNE